jgi:uncharacterized Fe-S center protein
MNAETDERGVKLVCATCGITNEELSTRSQATSKKPLKLRICSGCMQVYYCGIQCQRQQWEDHREECNRIMREREKGYEEHDSNQQ